MSYDLMMVEPAGRSDEGWFSMASANMGLVRGVMCAMGMAVASDPGVDPFGEAPLPLGIPVHKLSTNGAWLVTPREISAALLAYALVSEDLLRDARLQYERWDEWVAFVADAGEAGGFSVD